MTIARVTPVLSLLLVGALVACSSGDGRSDDDDRGPTESESGRTGRSADRTEPRDDGDADDGPPLPPGTPTSPEDEPPGGPSSGAKVGDQCEGNADCGSNSCLKGGNADFGYCTKTCESFSDCPTFWSCEQVGNATAKYCVQK